MNNWLTGLAIVLGAYVLGSLPFGYWAGWLKGIDIRQHGSGNIGATNVIRVMGKGIGIPVFILDVIKGWVAPFIAARWMTEANASETAVSAVTILSGIASILGHNFTFWLGFKGGKGVATSTGALLGIAPISVGVGLVVWLVVFFTTRYVSLASMGAAVAVPVTMAVTMVADQRWNFVMLGFGVTIAALVVLRHRPNIQRLLAGTENRAGSKKKSASTASRPSQGGAGS